MKKQIKTLLGVILSLVVAYLIARPCAIFLAESANNYVNKTESESIEKANLSLPSYQYSINSIENTNPEHTFKEQGFRVRFPMKPKVRNIGQIVQYEFDTRDEPAAYNIIINTVQESLMTNDSIDAYLKNYMLGRIMTYDGTGKTLKSQNILFLDHRALEYEYAKEVQGFNSYFKGIHFVRGNISYTISVNCIEEIKVSAYQRYDKFLSSFRLLD